MTDIERLEQKVDKLTEMVRQLVNDRHPRYIGTTEAAQILGVSRTTMSNRLNANYYPFAFKENDHWRIPVHELYRFQGQN